MTSFVLGRNRRNIGIVVSQISQSAVSFFLVLAAARALSPRDFGLLSIFWIVFTLAGSFMRSVCYEQLLASPTADDGLALALAAVVGSGLFLTAGAGGALLQNGVLTIWIVAIAFFWGSDGVRYALMAQRSSSSARLIAIDLSRGFLSLTAFALATVPMLSWAAATVACISGVVWPATCVRVRLKQPFSRVKRYILSRTSFEGYLVLQYTVGTGIVQLVPLYALLWLTPADLGYMRLAQSVVAPIAVMASAVQPAVILWLARRMSARQKWRATLVGVSWSIVLVTVGLALIRWVGPVAARTVVPQESMQGVSAVLFPVALSACLVFVGLPGGALIKTERFGRVSFGGQMVGALASISTVSVLLASGGGVRELAWGLAIGGLATVGFSYLLLRRAIRRVIRAQVAP